MRASSDKGTPETVSVVTTARPSHTEDRQLRQRRYAITQAVRVSCFLLAVLLPVPLGVKLALVAAALVLPLMGVVSANAGPVVVRKQRASSIVDRPASVADLPLRALDSTWVIEARVVEAEQ